MNPESKEGPKILRNSSMPSKLFRGEGTNNRTRTCHSQVNSMAQMGTSWRLRNNFLHTKSHISQSQTNKKHYLSRQLCTTLAEANTTDQLTKTMLRRLKTEAEDIDKTPKLVTGMTKLKQMHLLMARDLKKVIYEGKRKREVATDYHCRKTNPGYGRSICGRFYTS